MYMAKEKVPKIAILTCLADFKPSYSIAGVVHTQLEMLAKYEPDVVLVNGDDFKTPEDVPPGIDIRLYPRFHFNTKLDQMDMIEFEQYVIECGDKLVELLKDRTVVLVHDLIFLHDFLPLNWSIRRAMKKLPNLKWLHWVHSAPSTPPKELGYPLIGCYTLPPNSEIVYLNRYDTLSIAQMFACPENKVRLVHNCIDPVKLFKLHPLTVEIIEHYSLLTADQICIYPSRAVSGKQPDKIIKLMASMKNYHNQEVRFIFCNSWTKNEEEQKFIKDLISLAKSLGLTKDDVCITSLFKSKWAEENNYDIELGVPREVILDLMRLSDLFILPSVSEACSIIMLEAGISKNLMLLNDDLDSLKDFGGTKLTTNSSEKAIYFSFGSIKKPIRSYNPSEEEWFKDHARVLIEYQKSNHAINFFKQVRKYHNPDYIYWSQLKPLLD